jgi:BMFP domain-containing protein YqiC
MNSNREKFLAEKTEIELSLAAIRNRKQAKELDVLKRNMTPREEFSQRRQISIEARQEGDALREQLAAVNAKLAVTRIPQEQSQLQLLEGIMSVLEEIRDAIPRTESWK